MGSSSISGLRTEARTPDIGRRTSAAAVYCQRVVSRMMRRWLSFSCALVVVCGSTPGVVEPAAQSQATTASLLSAYADFVQGRRADLDLTVIDLDAARQDLARLDPASLPTPSGVSSEMAREAQRRLMTSFALELAAIGSRRHQSAAARLIEWACGYVRAHTPMNDFDRAWQFAALSALEGGIDSQTLRAHLTHLHGLDAEPRVLLAHGIVEEQFNAPSEVLTRSLTSADLARAREEMAHAEGEALRAADRAIARFKDAEANETARPEARVRLGHVELRLGRFDAALASWDGVENQTQDRALIYLTHVFRGLAYEGVNRTADARRSYEAALDVSPGAHSAVLRLAALVFRHDRGDEPSQLVDALLHNDDPRRDPWWSYYAGDWRFWYARIGRVRELLK
jgi:tetratricopeptide (TPR) repeat protein